MKSESNKHGVLVLGASGTGTSTLGHLLAQRFKSSFHETDFFFWEQTNPPFEVPRAPELRTNLLVEMVDTSPQFVLSGSICGWGEIVVPYLRMIVFLEATTESRLARILSREAMRYGAENIAPGGIYHDKVQKFLEWSKAYEIGGVSRTRELHETWLKSIETPVIRVNADHSIEEVYKAALEGLGR